MNPSKSVGDAGLLDDVPFFSCLSPAERQEVGSHCRFHEFGSDELIIMQGDRYTDVYFLISGKVHVLNYSEAGQAVSYATLSEGDIFGELSAIDDLPRSAWIRAMMPCTVMAMPGSYFRDLVTSHPGLSIVLLRILAGKIRMSSELIADFSILGADQRVCIGLITMAAPDPADSKSLIISPFPTQTNFAHVIGVSLETVSRILNQLREKRIIRQEDKTLYILRKRKLEQLALI